MHVDRRQLGGIGAGALDMVVTSFQVKDAVGKDTGWSEDVASFSELKVALNWVLYVGGRRGGVVAWRLRGLRKLPSHSRRYATQERVESLTFIPIPFMLIATRFYVLQ